MIDDKHLFKNILEYDFFSILYFCQFLFLNAKWKKMSVHENRTWFFEYVIHIVRKP